MFMLPLVSGNLTNNMYVCLYVCMHACIEWVGTCLYILRFSSGCRFVQYTPAKLIMPHYSKGTTTCMWRPLRSSDGRTGCRSKPPYFERDYLSGMSSTECANNAAVYHLTPDCIKLMRTQCSLVSQQYFFYSKYHFQRYIVIFQSGENN